MRPTKSVRISPEAYEILRKRKFKNKSTMQKEIDIALGVKSKNV